MLDFDNEDEFHEFKDTLLESLPGEITISQQRIARRNLEQLFRVIWKDEVVSFYTEKNQSYDRVLDIFIRANDGGTKLSKSDLLLSMITSKWEGIRFGRIVVNLTISKVLNELIDVPILSVFGLHFPEEKRRDWIALHKRIEKGDDLVWLPNIGPLNCWKKIAPIHPVNYAGNCRRAI